MASAAENGLMAGIMAAATGLALTVGTQIAQPYVDNIRYNIESAGHVSCQKLHVGREVSFFYDGNNETVYDQLDAARVADVDNALELTVDEVRNRLKVTYQGKTVMGKAEQPLDEIICSLEKQ